MKTIKSIIKLVINECACYSPILNGIKNYCDKEYDEDCCCRLFKDKRCGYFEKAVLPMNPQLETLYIAEHRAKQIGYQLTKQDREKIVEKESPVIGKVEKQCNRCKKIFLADNNRSQYCDKCKKYLRKEYQRDWVSKKRQSVVNVDNKIP